MTCLHNQILFSAISGSLPTRILDEQRFLPPLNISTSPNKSDGGDRVLYGIEESTRSRNNHLPPLTTPSSPNDSDSLVPKTTKYSDFRQQRLIQRQLQSSSEEEFDVERERYHRIRNSPRKIQKAKSPYPSY